MFGATTNYPFNFANRNGFPMIESANVTVNTDNVVIGIPKRAFRMLNNNGVILFRLNTALPESAGTLPILFASNEFTQPLTLVGGEAATATQLTGAGIYLIYYDKSCNLLQLLTYGPAAATTQSASTTTSDTEDTNNSMRTVKKNN
jgi:hypothetical protein